MENHEGTHYINKDDFAKEAMAHIDSLYRAAYRKTRNASDAEDLVQETYVRALTAFESFNEGTNCKAWLHRIQTNLFINKYRRRQLERENLYKERKGMLSNKMFCRQSQERFSNPEHSLLFDTVSDDVKAALEELPEEYRQVVELTDLQGHSYKQVAKMMKTPAGTVMSRLHRGRKLLAKSLEGFAQMEGIFGSKGSQNPATA